MPQRTPEPKPDPGTQDAAPAAVPASGSAAGGDAGRIGTRPGRDPGDAVPPGVAPAEPAPLTEADRRAKRQLERLPRGAERPLERNALDATPLARNAPGTPGSR